MLHRHLNHQGFTLAAIDDVISRGKWDDWAELRLATKSDETLLEKIEQICRTRASDQFAQRHHFWIHYVEQQRQNACMGTRSIVRSTPSAHPA